MDPLKESIQLETRRQFLNKVGMGLGSAVLASLFPQKGLAASPLHTARSIAPKAKRVIYLTMSGGPSQIDLFDYKPGLQKRFKEELPDSIRQGQRLTGMTANQTAFPVAPSMYKFQQYGQSGAWISELLPHFSSIADDVTIIRSLHTDAINHDPAITYMMTGNEIPGKPCVGAWLSYGLGSINKDLPSFVVLNSKWSAKRAAQALYDRLWGSGFLPTEHQGVAFRSSGDPVLYLSNPPGVSKQSRRHMLNALAKMNEKRFSEIGDPEIQARITQSEMAFRMQTSVPELTDLSSESDKMFDLYGPQSRDPGSFASNCLLARRLIERDVRFVQIFHRGWDQHGDLPRDHGLQCGDVDQAMTALVIDLKQRGLLDDTLVVWAGEFGRTVYCQGKLAADNYGRDHHPRCFSIWMAGGGVKGGMVYGETDDYSYNIVKDPVHVRDLNATILHLSGLSHEQLSFRAQGLDQRLTGVEEAHVVKDILI